MKKALVIGASGGMGYSIVKELSARGIAVIAFARTKAKLEKLFTGMPNVTIYAGDLFRQEDLQEAAKDVDVVFQAANLPYQEWESKLVSLMTNILAVSKKLAVVDNIYAYGRSSGEKVREDFTKNPHTKKGRIRLEVENLIKKSGVPTVIAHFPDFYGPNAENTILQYTLANVVENKKAMYVGDQKIGREFIYTPDGAKAIINLALEEKAYGQNWNIPGFGVVTGEELITMIRDITRYDKGVSTVSKNMIRFLGLFNSGMREVVEMFYLNEEPVILNGEKYEKLIGELPRTPYREGLEQTIAHMRQTL